MENLQNIKPKEVFKHFYNISQIPRGSGNEKEISNYLFDFAKKLNLEVVQDDALNIIIKKKATKGYENAPTVIIQGHMDMVCEKNNDTKHDFEKDPIELVVKGDELYANGTTLGADDGIAVAYAMALLEDNTIEHPALEVLLTTDEETGMTGAIGLKKEHISGKVLINIDTEEEGYLLVSCAGGIRTKSSIKIEREANWKDETFAIKVRGLKGGHSGCDIHLGRGNSNKIIGRILKDLNEKFDIGIVSINGGSKNNAIPREADAIITINNKDEVSIKETLANWDNIIKNELAQSDANVSIELEKLELDEKILTKECAKKVVDLLYLYPNGVNTMSTTIDGLTESSTNLGIVATNENEIEFDSAVRSSIDSLKDEIVNRIKTISEVIGADFEATAGYPGWEYNPNSKIREICKDVYKKVTGEEAIVYAIHAGVECGLFQEKLGDLDMISFGPNINDAHTPNEHLSISSTERVWNYLIEVLKEMKNY